MDGQQHMTITEAHPYHEGRGCKVFNPNCPLCRNDSAKETTYVGWSLHQATLAAAEARATAAEARVLELEAECERWRAAMEAANANMRQTIETARAALRKDATPTTTSPQ